jgi:hypothetical protein
MSREAATEAHDLLVHHVAGDLSGLTFDTDRAVVVELNGRADCDGSLEADGLDLDDFEVGLVDGFDGLGFYGFVVSVGNEGVERFADKTFTSDEAFDDGAGGFAGPKTGYPGLAGHALIGGIEGLFETLGVDLDIELHTAFGKPFNGYLHGMVGASDS